MVGIAILATCPSWTKRVVRLCAVSLKKRPHPGGGQWNGPKVAEWTSADLGRYVWPSRGWDYLRYLGYSPQRPRLQHEKVADEEAQRRYQSRPQCVSLINRM